jgi:hypothetical protein
MGIVNSLGFRPEAASLGVRTYSTDQREEATRWVSEGVD